MKRLYLFCEGATEQGFCKQVLAPHLQPAVLVHPILIAHGKHRGRVHRGGIPDHFQGPDESSIGFPDTRLKK